MVGGAGLADQVVALSAIDFFTGETLLDALVEPAAPVTQWRTAITGITRESVAAAVAAGTALRGTRQAVARLFELADAETVLVGHSLWHGMLGFLFALLILDRLGSPQLPVGSRCVLPLEYRRLDSEWPPIPPE
jgi:hypothetical protein